jgi:hypothetical protein
MAADLYPSAQWAWQTAERRCFDYLQTKLGTLENVGGYLGELPRVALVDDQLNEWTFRISGGGNVHVPPPGQRPTAWHNEAMFEGRFTDRSLAMQTIGILRDSLPAGEDFADDATALAGVQKLYFTAHPALDRGTVEVDADGAATESIIRVWTVTVPMAVAYNNQPQIT